jgi:hypothetical protein
MGPGPLENTESSSDGCGLAGQRRKSGFHSLRLLLGRLILRACPSGSKVQVCEGCHLRPLCKCAQEHFRAAAAVEGKFWALIALAAGLALLYALISSLRPA